MGPFVSGTPLREGRRASLSPPTATLPLQSTLLPTARLSPPPVVTVGPSIATPESVAVLALSVDGSLVASGDIQGTIQISRLESGARIGEPLVGEDPLLHA